MRSFRHYCVQEIPSFQDISPEIFFSREGIKRLMGTADIIPNEFKDDELRVIVGLVSADGLEIVEMARTST